MYLNSLINLLGGNVINFKENILINNFVTNSLKALKNDCFICINSGYKYIADASLNGAKVVILEKEIPYNIDITYILVSSIDNALKQIGAYILSLKKINIIAITGSVGKTTTKELLSLGLSKKYKVLKNEGNKNNLYGILETIFKLTDDIEYLVLEVGMNHRYEISEISKMLKPDIGVITNIGSAHIGNLGSVKEILKAKLEILDGNKDMKLFVNGEDKYLNKISAFKVYKVYNEKILNVDFDYMIMNYYLVISVLNYLKIDINLYLNDLLNYKMYKQRMNVLNIKDITIIDDTYNASLESVIGGLSYLKKYNNEKIIILGDILELGKHSIKIHKKINKYLKKVRNKHTLLIGKYTKYINGKHFFNHDELINYLKNINITNKVIYLKGSRKMRMEKIIKNLLNFKI